MLHRVSPGLTCGVRGSVEPRTVSRITPAGTGPVVASDLVNVSALADDVDARLAFSTVEACAAADVTYRMADNWIRAGAVTPSIAAAAGSGTRRRWSIVDVERLTRIGRVIDRAEAAGFLVTCQAIAAMWDALEAGDGWRLELDA